MLEPETKLPETVESDNSPSVEVIPLGPQRSSIVFCKICHSGGSCEQLIHPCFCKGSVGNVHLTCLERWLNECGVDRCELCLFQFTSEQTRRYTVWQSLVIWSRNPTARRLLFADLIVLAIITTAVSFLVACMAMGLSVFQTPKIENSMDMVGFCLSVVFMAVTVLSYIFTVCMIIRSNVRPWYTWYKRCRIIRLNREHLSAGTPV